MRELVGQARTLLALQRRDVIVDVQSCTSGVMAARGER